MIGTTFLVIIILVLQNPKALGLVGLLVLLVLARLVGELTDREIARKLKLEKHAIRGAEAEERIGEILDTLPSDTYYVLNDVESPYGNIDHIVIRKYCGIFLFETKAHRGKVKQPVKPYGSMESYLKRILSRKRFKIRVGYEKQYGNSLVGGPG
ncbi:MAG: NERD domain-containing protein [Anaerolineales bacterium]|nr:NERD domain-containing protein [Anaerolineales bacterium]